MKLALLTLLLAAAPAHAGIYYNLSQHASSAALVLNGTNVTDQFDAVALSTTTNAAAAQAAAVSASTGTAAALALANAAIVAATTGTVAATNAGLYAASTAAAASLPLHAKADTAGNSDTTTNAMYTNSHNNPSVHQSMPNGLTVSTLTVNGSAIVRGPFTVAGASATVQGNFQANGVIKAYAQFAPQICSQFYQTAGVGSGIGQWEMAGMSGDGANTVTWAQHSGVVTNPGLAGYSADYILSNAQSGEMTEAFRIRHSTMDINGGFMWGESGTKSTGTKAGGLDAVGQIQAKATGNATYSVTASSGIYATKEIVTATDVCIAGGMCLSHVSDGTEVFSSSCTWTPDFSTSLDKAHVCYSTVTVTVPSKGGRIMAVWEGTFLIGGVPTNIPIVNFLVDGAIPAPYTGTYGAGTVGPMVFDSNVVSNSVSGRSWSWNSNELYQAGTYNICSAVGSYGASNTIQLAHASGTAAHFCAYVINSRGQ